MGDLPLVAFCGLEFEHVEHTTLDKKWHCTGVLAAIKGTTNADLEWTKPTVLPRIGITPTDPAIEDRVRKAYLLGSLTRFILEDEDLVFVEAYMPEDRVDFESAIVDGTYRITIERIS